MPAVIDEHHQFTNLDGKPIVNGFMYIGTVNTDPKLNPITIYADRILTTPIANPQRTDLYGRSVNKIWIPDQYSLLIEDEDNVQQYQELDLGEPAGSSAGITTLSNVQGSNAITADASNTIVEYTDNETYIFKAANANTSSGTLNIDGVGAKPLVHSKNVDLKLGDIKQGQTLVVLYSATEDNFQLTNHGEVKINPNASTAPTVNNDITQGYTVGSEWHDINNKLSYICINNNAGAAQWNILGIKNNFSATTAPTSTDDASEGYNEGSTWVNKNLEKAYINVDKTENASKWLEMTTFVIDKSHWPTVANDGTDADHDIVFSAGRIADSTGTSIINLTSALTKQVDIVWAEGNNAGGFPSGVNSGNVAADTTYHLFVIAKADGTVDAGFDISLTATNLLADATGYTLYRRVGSMLTDGLSNWLGFSQFGHDFFYDVSIQDFNTITGTSKNTVTLSVPNNIQVMAKVRLTTDGVVVSNTEIILQQLGETDAAPSLTAVPGVTMHHVASSGGAAQTEVLTNTSAQIGLRASANISADLFTYGYRDERLN